MSPFGATQHVVRLVEVVGVAPAARRAERHQQLAVRAVLEHLVADQRRRRRRERRIRRRAARAARPVVLPVGHPDVAVVIDVDPVREDHRPGAEAGEQLAGRVELEDRISVESEAGVGAAALADPDRLAVLVDVDGARRAPRAPLGHLEVVLDRRVRIRQIVGRRLRGDRRQRPRCRPRRWRRRTAPILSAIPCPDHSSSPARGPCRRTSAGAVPRRSRPYRCCLSSRARCCARRRTVPAAGRRRRTS